MKIERELKILLQNDLLSGGKIVVLYGARQTGKTTLAKDIFSNIEGKTLQINADELRFTDVLSSRDLNKLKLLFEGYQYAFIDEAQRIPDIGINLKIIHDNLPDLKLLVTGSSSFDLANQVKEPLTGRTVTHRMFPISVSELRRLYNPFELQARLEELMTFGMYPDIFQYPAAHEKEKYLRELSSSYLYKDILELSSIRNSGKIADLLKLLAFQIGSEVSLSEIGQKLGLRQETVTSYIDLLEKSFIVFRLKAFNRNMRKEISKRDKIYFWDLGVRNTLINNFSGFGFRNDIGALWENFIISERQKHLSYNEIYANSYFWRTYTGAELDYIEEKNGELNAFEIKYNKQRKNAPASWIENYGSDFRCITKDNFWEYIS